MNDTGAVVGLDLSLTGTGLAVIYPNGTRSTQLVATKQRGHERMAFVLTSTLAFVDAVERLCGIREIHIEGPSYGSQGQGHFDIGGLTWLVKHRLWELGFTYVDVPPSTLKKWATGRGNAKKSDMLATAIRKHGYEGSDDNEADALLLAIRAIALAETTDPERGRR